MTDYRSDAEHHLHQAAQFTPGSADERFHTHTASVLASLYAADANREQAAAAERLIGIQERLFALMAEPQQAATAEEPTQ